MPCYRSLNRGSARDMNFVPPRFAIANGFAISDAEEKAIERWKKVRDADPALEDTSENGDGRFQPNEVKDEIKSFVLAASQQDTG